MKIIKTVKFTHYYIVYFNKSKSRVSKNRFVTTKLFKICLLVSSKIGHIDVLVYITQVSDS